MFWDVFWSDCTKYHWIMYVSQSKTIQNRVVLAYCLCVIWIFERILHRFSFLFCIYQAANNKNEAGTDIVWNHFLYIFIVCTRLSDATFSLLELSDITAAPYLSWLNLVFFLLLSQPLFHPYLQSVNVWDYFSSFILIATGDFMQIKLIVYKLKLYVFVAEWTMGWV